MKPGLKVGDTAEVELQVTPDMVAEFDGRVIHKLYCTSALAYHMEWAARKVIEPYFEENEEAVGYNVDCTHLAMTIPGMKVRVRATLTEIRDRKIVCDIEAFNTRGKLARGSVTQSVIDKSWLSRKVNELTLINQLSAQSGGATANA